MIKIEVDEAYAFDMLAINRIKYNIGTVSQFYDLYNSIEDQIGRVKLEQIINSNEWYNLIEANQEVFDYVEKLNEGNPFITALDIHNANMDRYRHKRELQRVFFNSELTEQKTKF